MRESRERHLSDMNDRICYIFGAARYEKLNLNPETLKKGFVIAADGGYERLGELNILPDLLVGDFDSLSVIPEIENVVRHPVMKDKTDMHLAADEGLKHGCKRFVIYGGLGGRLDHTIANIQLLKYLAERGASGFLVSKKVSLTAMRDSCLRFDRRYRGTVSVFCMGDKAQGVTLEGLKYPLNDAVLTDENPVGVSNSFTGREAVLKVSGGTLLVSWLRNIDKPLPETYNLEKYDQGSL